MTKPLRVLLVEDSESDGELVIRLLQQAGYDVTHERVQTAEAMTAALQSTVWDIVLSDYSMPAFDAQSALDLLKAAQLDIPFIAVSGAIGEEVAVQLMKSGASDFVMKDKLGRLTAAVERELNEAESRREKRKNEAALRESEERYRALTGTTTDGFWVVNETGWLMEVNDAYCAMSGFSRDQLLAMQVTELELLETPEQTQERISQIQRSGWAHFESQHRRADGSMLEVEVNVAALRTQNQMIVFLKDITERKQAEKELSRVHRSQQALLNSIPDLAWLKDAEGRFISVNQTFARSLERPIEEFPGKNDYDFYPRELADQYRADDQSVILSGKPKRVEERYLGSSGIELWIETIKVPFLDDTGRVIGTAGVARDITERKLAEKALRDSERRLLDAQQIAHIGDWTWNLESNSLIWSAEHYRMFGLSPQDGPLPYAAFIEFVIPEDREALNSSIQAAMSDKSPYDVDFTIIRADGARRIVNARGKVAFDESGKATAMSGTIQDITERKQAEESLRQSAALLRHANDRFSLAADAAKLGVWDMDLANNALKWDARMCALYGVVQEEFVASLENWQNLLHPDDVARAQAEALAAIDSSQVYESEYRVVWPSGEVRHLVTMAHITRDEAGKALRVTGINIDITERKRAEEERVLLQTAIEKSGDVVTITDAQGIYRSVNPAFERLTGFTSQEAVGRKPNINSSGRHSREFYAHLWETISNGEVWSGRLTNKRKDGRIYLVDTVITPIANKAGEIISYVAVKRDVTDQVRKELELRQAQKLEAIGQLAAGIAHEINTPMQYVNDNTVFLKDAMVSLLKYTKMFELVMSQQEAGQVDAFALKQALQMMHDADIAYLIKEIPQALDQSLEGINRVTKIVHAMKEFSHPALDEKAFIDINRAIESTITIARNEWKYVADVQTDLSPNLPLVPCFPGMINQVILNLLTNAAHAIAENADTEHRGKGIIAVTTSPHDGYVEMRITDTGAGIPEAIRDRVFDPFFTTKSVGKGTGQGLAMAHAAIVERHKGSISFESEIGVGTSFVIQLPVAPPT